MFSAEEGGRERSREGGEGFKNVILSSAALRERRCRRGACFGSAARATGSLEDNGLRRSGMGLGTREILAPMVIYAIESVCGGRR